ncbi:MAG TPA: hypothetical protein VEY88_17400, partial [Archangium sp.]|nr:hypothetical protein [Archangium sp.]
MGRVAAEMLRDRGVHTLQRLVRPPRPNTTGRERLLRASSIRRQSLKLYFLAGQPLQGLYSLLRGLLEAEEAGPSNELVRVWVMASAFFSTLGMRRIAQSYYDSALRALPEVKDLGTVSFVNHIGALFHMFNGDWALALPMFEKALALDEQLGARQTEAGLHPRSDLALMLLHMGRHGDSAVGYEDVLGGARRIGESMAELQAHAFFAEVERRRGRMDLAREHAEQALALIGEQQFPGQKLVALSVLALVQPQAAHTLVRKAEPLLKFTPGAHFSFYVGLSNVMEAHLQLLATGGLSPRERKASEQAIALILKSLQGFTKVYRFGEPTLWLCEARWARSQGRHEDALAAARRSVELARSLKMPHEEGLALRERAACTSNPVERERDLAEATRVLASTNTPPQRNTEPTEARRAS